MKIFFLEEKASRIEKMCSQTIPSRYVRIQHAKLFRIFIELLVVPQILNFLRLLFL